MAVYKATYCFPFLNSCNAKITAEDDPYYFKCQIDSSNKNVTGYQITLLNSENEQVFKGAYISPVSELTGAQLFPLEPSTNTGVNGTYLKIPFIQNSANANRVLTSYNCIYYNGSNWVDYNGVQLSSPMFNNNAGSWKWVITLFQGAGVVSGSADPTYIDYSNLSNDDYDAIITTGKVLGSTGARIQTNPTDKIYANYFIQLAQSDNTNIYTRQLIKTYDSTYGHIYPETGAIQDSTIGQEAVSNFKVYKHSNNEEYILPSEKVVCATNSPINFASAQATIDGISLTANDWVLLMNQENPIYNGVWLFPGPTSTDWIRAGSYDTWGNFIGAFLYVQNGSFGGRNFESQAKAGNYQLAKTCPVTTPSDYAPLYFNEEEPVVLYPNLLTATVDFYDNENHSPYIVGNVVDSYSLQSGDTVLTSGGIYTTGGGSTPVGLVLNGLYKVERGKELGGNKVYKYASSFYEDYSISLGDILKNEVGKTYIKPFVGLEPGMKLFFLNPGASDPTVLVIDSVDTTLWAITHTTLSSGGLSSSNPLSYQIRSYFKSSDENPFYTYDAPVVTIPTTQDFQTVDGEVLYVVLPPAEQLFEVPVVSAAQIITTRYIKLIGTYSQGQNQSWTNFRWLLTNALGEIIQDTGKFYSGDIAVDFYGLSDQHTYYAVLMIEDVLGNIVATSIRFTVALSPVSTPGILNANLNCKTQGVDLSFTVGCPVKASANEGTTIQEYTNTNLTYTDGNMNIGLSNFGSTAYTADATTNPETVGINYTYWFPIGENSFPLTDAAAQTLGMADGNDFVVTMKTRLNGDFCGKIMQANIDINTTTGITPLGIQLRIPEDCISTGSLNPDRNKILVRLVNGDTNAEISTQWAILSGADVDTTNNTWYPIDVEGVATGRNTVYKYQPNSILGATNMDTTEFLDSRYFINSDGGIDTNYYNDPVISSIDPDGNDPAVYPLCLDDDPTPDGYSVWLEHAVSLHATGGSIQRYALDTDVDTWPDSTTETGYYWSDGTVLSVAPNEYKRRKWLENYILNIEIRCSSPDALLGGGGNLFVKIFFEEV